MSMTPEEVKRIYNALTLDGRDPDPGGLAHWTKVGDPVALSLALLQGETVPKIRAEFEAYKAVLDNMVHHGADVNAVVQEIIRRLGNE